MDEKIKEWMGKNKFLFLLLIPVVLVIFFKDVIFSLLIGSARKVSNEAKKEDEALKSVADKANNEAALHQQKADDLAKKIEDRTEDDIKEDWNKK